MSDDFSPALRRELLEDFYNESDELFRQIAGNFDVLAADPQAGAAREAVEGLYRGVHTFKGLCGIIGLRDGEQLAHGIEDMLRSLTRGESKPDAAIVDLLSQGIHRLTEIVAAHRMQETAPPVEELVRAFGRFRSTTAPAPAHPIEAPANAGAAATGTDEPRWLATFSPSRELDQRGVNITSVRRRLEALGPIAKAAPVVRGDGSMVFEFSLRLNAAPADLPGWSADGVVWRPSETAPAPNTQSPAPSAAADTVAARSVAPSHIVRVDLGRLDDLMRIMGEMVIHRSRLEERITRLPGDHTELQEVNLALARSLRDLRSAITRVRLVPVDEMFTQLPFVVRDLARDSDRRVRLVLKGQETEIDKYLVERLREPLLHFVRNAISHGIEPPAERAAAGKPEEATLTISATALGHTVVLEIRDDGRGVDPTKVIARATALGLPVPANPSMTDILNILCQPGFSTRHEADRASGRGVGMSVVHTTVRELGGLLSLETSLGEWTQFTLRLPLTLSIADTFIVSAGEQTCAVPQSFISEVIQIEEDQVRIVQQTEMVPYRDGVLPIIRLSTFLGVQARTRTRVPVLVVSTERGSAGLVVDRVHGQREVVVRPMSDPLLQVRGVSGATELGDGRPVLILDAAALTGSVVRPHRDSSAPATSVTATAAA